VLEWGRVANIAAVYVQHCRMLGEEFRGIKRVESR
jgi:hypothetical protein